MALQHAINLNMVDPALDRRGHHISSYYDAFGIIAKGGFGSVMLGKKKNVQPVEYVAIKKTPRSTDKEEEEEVLWRVRHQPFLLKYLEKEKYGNSNFYYTVTEYCPGGNLHQVSYANRGFTEDVMRFYACELVMAVAVLHKKGILHLDIKPENILFDKDSHIVLIDFGMSMRTKNRQDRCMVFCPLAGTRGYQSPEYLARREVHESSDWWAVGVVCCEMLDLHKPFACGIKNPVEIRRAVLNDEPQIPDFLSGPAASFLAELLVKEPQFRLGFSNTDSVLSHRFFEGVDWRTVRSKKRKSPIISKLILPDLPGARTHYPDAVADLPTLRQKYRVKSNWIVDKERNSSSLGLQLPLEVDADLLDTTDDYGEEENLISYAMEIMFLL